MIDTNSTAKFREHVILFFEQHDLASTIEAFKVSKPTIYRWRKRYIESFRNPASLVPKSRCPHNKRTMQVDYRIVEFIKELRQKRWRIGKEKIKPLLDEYCASNTMTSISQSKIGRIISKNNLFYSPYKVYHNGKVKAYKRYKEKIKKAPKPKDFGYIQIDTIAKFVLGIKTYIYNAIDVKLKFQFSYGYKRSNSLNALDFFKKLQEVYPIPKGINTVQTDNGSEFQGEFSKYLREVGIKQVYIYPRCPKINGCIERANRSLREEFIDLNDHLILAGLDKFNLKLIEHLIWYNTKRVHKTLKNISPIDYLLKVLPESHMYWTHTLI
jgi:transposase InsO family protein